MMRVTPLRFVSGTVALWTAARLAVLMPDLLTAPAEADLRRPPARPTSGSILASRTASGPTFAQAPPARGRVPHADAPPPARRHLPLAGIDPGAPSRFASRSADPPVDEPQAVPGADRLLLSPVGVVSPSPVEAPAPRAVARSRWSGGAYLFHRGDGRDGAALASGGQLGGSQAGARIAWSLDREGPPRLSLAARVSTPLDDTRGAEGAAGIDWHPLPGRPLRVSIERRIDLGGAGRDAFSAYAAGGFWRPIGRAAVVDGYAQAGIVGARRRDLFADGALRAGHRLPVGPESTLTLGGGAWGAAQPGVARLDIGPRAAMSLPLGRTSVTAAAEWRMRVAGDARPGSGLALTLSSDF